MASKRLTIKGQTTVPAEIRKHLGIAPGDLVEFVIDERGEVVLKAASLDISDLKGFLAQKTKKRLSIEQMNDVIRKRGSQR